MTPQKQLFRHKPAEGVFGDCYRTCIACLLDLAPADVPHFYDRLENEDPENKGRDLRDGWLRERGFFVVSIPFAAGDGLAGVLTTMGALNPASYFILSGESRTGVNHSVIACGGQIIHDPSLTDSGIIGPCNDGLFWIEILSPIAMKAAA